MTEDPVAKRQKLSGPLIGTHNGHFHADEALAVYLLRLLPTYTSSPLVRTRDPEQLSQCHTVVDVGGEYDASRFRFDHHQRGFDTTFPGHSSKLSAAGLVYLHLGRDVIAAITGLAANAEETGILYEKIYTDLIEAFDANDNGINNYDAGAVKKFEDTRFTLAAAVGRFNYRNRNEAEEENMSKEELQAKEDERFLVASHFVGEQFVMEVTDAFKAWLPSRGIVREAYSQRFQVHKSGKILVLPHRKGGLPWADHLYECEDEAGGEDGKILYVLFPENGDADTKWRIRSVSIARGQFKNRKDLPDAWKGLRDDALSQASGVPGGVFVHASGFIGGNTTYEGAMAMAVIAVDQ